MVGLSLLKDFLKAFFLTMQWELGESGKFVSRLLPLLIAVLSPSCSARGRNSLINKMYRKTFLLHLEKQMRLEGRKQALAVFWEKGGLLKGAGAAKERSHSVEEGMLCVNGGDEMGEVPRRRA